MRLSSSRHCMVSLYVALPGAAPSRMGHPHHDSHRKGAHALVSQTMEVPQTGLNHPNQPAPLIRHRPPLSSCGDIGTVLRLQSAKTVRISPQLTNNWVSSGTEISIELTARQEKGLFTTFNSRGPTIPAFLKIDKPSTCGFNFIIFVMVEGVVANVVDRPILWHTTHSSPISKAKGSLSSTPASENQIE